MLSRILITGQLHESAIQAFEARADFSVVYAPDCTREKLYSLAPECHVLVTRSETDVNRQLIDIAKDLKVIARAAVGVGNIDIDYATEKGVLVINCPGKNTNSAAELTFGLLLGMLRNLPQAQMHLKNGGWDRHRFAGRELRGKRLGIVGLGNVGHRVAKFARGFDMDVYAYDPYIAPAVFQRHEVKPLATLIDLLKVSDVLTVHVPLNKETRGMVDAPLLATMPCGAYVVNAARGGIIDEQALLAQLNSGKIAGAAIDTWDFEPTPLPELLNHPHVWCSPHIGASTLEAQIAIGQTIYEQVDKALTGGVVDHPVNLPQIAVIDSPLLKAYAVLSEKLGALVGQILEFNPSKIELSYRGDLASLDHGIVRLGLMKGYAGQVVDGYVSFVNAMSHFDNLGIAIKEKTDPGFDSYKSALKVHISGPDGRELTVGGIVFDDRYPRISLINDYYFELEPSGEIVLLENEDRPGVIGDVGHFLATRGVNIDTFALSRNRKGGRAMALIRVDSPLTMEQAKDMGKITNVTAVKSVRL